MTRKKMALIIAFNMILAVVALLWYRHTSPFSLVCQGNLTFSDQRVTSPFRFEGGVTLRFHTNGTGYFTLNGDVINDQHQWQVSRQETFSWQRMQNSVYEITIQKIEKFGHDELPVGIFEKYIAGLTLGKKRLITLERTPEDAVVLSNFYSPLLICAD